VNSSNLCGFYLGKEDETFEKGLLAKAWRMLGECQGFKAAEVISVVYSFQ